MTFWFYFLWVKQENILNKKHQQSATKYIGNIQQMPKNSSTRKEGEQNILEKGDQKLYTT